MEKIEIFIRDNGTLSERTIIERDLKAEPEVLAALSADVTRSQRNVMPIPGWGMAHASVGLDDTIWSVAIDRLPLKARFSMDKGVLIPLFASLNDLEMPLVWQPPKEMRLIFVVRTEFLEECVSVEGNWLFAYSPDNKGYRLPLPKLHDECSLCTGDFEEDYDSGLAAVIASLKQFEASKWNSDLMRTVVQSKKFFRFRPTNETFETLPIEAADWTTLCNYVSTAIMDRVIL